LPQLAHQLSGISILVIVHLTSDVVTLRCIDLKSRSTHQPSLGASDLYLGEVSGFALNSAGHIFVLLRGSSAGPLYGAAASQLLEFDATGEYLREIGLRRAIR
jgi:hypothetical protein